MLARSRCRYERKSGGQRENERKWKMLPSLDNGQWTIGRSSVGRVGFAGRREPAEGGGMVWLADENLKYIYPHTQHTHAHTQCHKATTLNFRSSKIYAKDADVPADAKKNVRLCG